MSVTFAYACKSAIGRAPVGAVGIRCSWPWKPGWRPAISTPAVHLLNAAESVSRYEMIDENDALPSTFPSPSSIHKILNNGNSHRRRSWEFNYDELSPYYEAGEFTWMQIYVTGDFGRDIAGQCSTLRQITGNSVTIYLLASPG